MQGRVRWLFLDLNSFFASCEQQENPKLRGKPVGVVPVMTGSTCVIAASYPAKAKGIRTGTLVSDAISLCPEITFVPSRPDVYVRYHNRILDVIKKHLPVDDEHVMSIDELAIRLLGDECVVENASRIAQRIKQAILDEVGESMTCSVGLAPNRFLAKVASNMQKPNGLTALPQEVLEEKLATLKLRDMPGLGPRMERRLFMHGIFDMRQLWKVDSLRMRAIWGGVNGLRFYTDLHGEEWPYRASTPSVLGHQHVLEPQFRSSAGALEVLQRLLAKAAERLRDKKFYCKELSVTVKLLDSEGYFSVSQRFGQTQDTTFLLEQLRKLWQSYPGQKPLRVGVMLHNLIPASLHQLDLFDQPRKTQLVTAIDKINKKFGRYTIRFGLNNALKEGTDMDRIAFQRVPTEYEVSGKGEKARAS